MDKNLQYTLSLKDLFSKKMKAAGDETAKLDNKMTSLKNKMSGVGNAFAALGIAAGAIGFGKAVIESLKNYEYFSAALKTMLHGDANAAKALQGQLVTLAKTTPFSLNEVQDATKQLLAYGFEAGQVTKNIKMLGDVSAGVGAPLGDIAYLYGTLKTSGRVTLMDLRQFAGRGIPIYETLAKKIQKTGESFDSAKGRINSMVHDGKLGFKDIENAFKSMTSEGGQFFKLMEDQSKTVGGRLSNMGDAWEQLKVNIGKSQTGIISSTVSWAGDMINKLNDIVAAANRMDEAFKSSQVKGYSAIENFNNWLFAGTTNDYINKQFTGGKGKMEMLDRSLQSMYVDPSGRDKKSALQSDAQLKQLRVGYDKAYLNKEIDKTEYERSNALFESALKQISGNITLFGKKGEASGMDSLKGKEGGGSGSSSSLGTGTEVTGNRPQNLNITINGGFVHEMTISATTITESSSKVKEMVGKALMEAVNDVNIMDR